MSSQGSGGPFDGIVHDGTFESDLEKLADIVKETQQELNVSFWSTSVMRATLTVADSHDYVRAKTRNETAIAAKAKIKELEQLKSALTMSERLIQLQNLRQQLKLTGYPLLQMVENDIQKATQEHEAGWKFPISSAGELRELAQVQSRKSEHDPEGTDNQPKLGPRVVEACKETIIDWLALRDALKVDKTTLEEIAPQAARELSTWMSLFKHWKPSSPCIQAALADAVDEVGRTCDELLKAEFIATHCEPTNHDKLKEIGEALDKCLEPPRTGEELRKMFMRMPSGKTGGPSGATREHYIHLPDFMLTKLVPLVERIYLGQAPDRLRLGVISPLLKNDFKYRPVTLLESLWKCCMTRVSDKLLDVIAKYQLLDETQYAFLRGGSTVTPLNVMAAITQDSSRREKNCHVALLDATSAYDVVPDWVIDLALTRIGASKTFVCWAKASTSGHHRLVKTGSGISEEDNAFELGGLPQGCPMSPVLWAIVADFAISFASKHGGKGYDFGQVLPDSDDTVEVRFMAYADDLICISDTKAGLEQTVQSMTTILSCFNIRLSPKKCVYMWSRAAHEDLMSRSSNLGDIDIRGLELVSMKPRANGKKTREGTPTTVGVVGKTAKHKRDTFEIDWTDECT
jgi:hypothetical protein